MGDQKLVVDNLRFEYEGPFQFRELIELIGTYIYDKGYDKSMEKDFEQNTPNGRYIEWQLNPWKKLTDYIRIESRVKILAYDLIDKEMMINGEIKKVQDGRILIIFEGYIEHDYDMRWEEKPMFVFWRAIVNKYIDAIYNVKFEHILRDHINQMYLQIQRFFNVYTTPGMKTLPPSPILPHHHHPPGH